MGKSASHPRRFLQKPADRPAGYAASRHAGLDVLIKVGHIDGDFLERGYSRFKRKQNFGNVAESLVVCVKSGVGEGLLGEDMRTLWANQENARWKSLKTEFSSKRFPCPIAVKKNLAGYLLTSEEKSSRYISKRV